MSTTAIPQPNPTVDKIITEATADLTKLAPSVGQGLANIAAILNTPGQSHIAMTANLIGASLQAATQFPNPTVQEIAGFSLVVENLVVALVGFFHKPAAVAAAPVPVTVIPAVTPALVNPNVAIAAAAPIEAAPVAHVAKETFAQESGTDKLKTVLSAGIFHAQNPTLTAAAPATPAKP